MLLPFGHSVSPSLRPAYPPTPPSANYPCRAVPAVQDAPRPDADVDELADDEYGSGGQAPMTLLPAPEPPLNQLYYQRPAAPLSDKERSKQPLGPPKSINRAGTRLRTAPEAPPPSAVPDGTAELPVGAPAPGGAGGTVGYSPMATPALSEVMASPLMTWGDIGSTPLRLGADELLPEAMPVLDAEGGAGPAFTVQVGRVAGWGVGGHGWAGAGVLLPCRCWMWRGVCGRPSRCRCGLVQGSGVGRVVDAWEAMESELHVQGCSMGGRRGWRGLAAFRGCRSCRRFLLKTWHGLIFETSI